MMLEWIAVDLNFDSYEALKLLSYSASVFLLPVPKPAETVGSNLGLDPSRGGIFENCA